MKSVEAYRKMCLKQQTELRRIMMGFDQHDQAIQLFLSQHATLHSARMAQTEPWSFEDQVFSDMFEEQIVTITGGNSTVKYAHRLVTGPATFVTTAQ